MSPPIVDAIAPKMASMIAMIPTASPAKPPKSPPRIPPVTPPSTARPTIASIAMMIPPNIPARKPANAPVTVPPRAMTPAANPPMNPPIRCPIPGNSQPKSSVMTKPTKAPSHKLPIKSLLFFSSQNLSPSQQPIDLQVGQSQAVYVSMCLRQVKQRNPLPTISRE